MINLLGLKIFRTFSINSSNESCEVANWRIVVKARIQNQRGGRYWDDYKFTHVSWLYAHNVLINDAFQFFPLRKHVWQNNGMQNVTCHRLNSITQYAHPRKYVKSKPDLNSSSHTYKLHIRLETCIREFRLRRNMDGKIWILTKKFTQCKIIRNYK